MVSVFFLYPAFHYSKIFGNIVEKSCIHYDSDEGRYIPGPGYTYDDLFEPIYGKFTIPTVTYYHGNLNI